MESVGTFAKRPKLQAERLCERIDEEIQVQGYQTPWELTDGCSSDALSVFETAGKLFLLGHHEGLSQATPCKN